MEESAAVSKAVFLDRDGTLIEERDYLRDPDQVAVFPGAGESLKRLRDAGFLLVIVSNQSGVGRGYFALADVTKVQARVDLEFARYGVKFDRCYIAPEVPDQPSRGRKPSPQFLFDARDELGVDLTRSYMVGDKLIDLQCGRNAGVRQALLVRTGYGAALEKAKPGELGGAIVVNDLPAAADWILSDAS